MKTKSTLFLIVGFIFLHITSCKVMTYTNTARRGGEFVMESKNIESSVESCDYKSKYIISFMDFCANSEQDAQYNKENGIRVAEEISYSFNKKGEKVVYPSSFHKYDQEGRILSEQYCYRNEKNVGKHKYEYNQIGQIVRYSRYKNEKLITESIVKYNENGYPVLFEKFRKGKLKAQIGAEYQDTLITKQWYCKSGSKKKFTENLYEYKDDKTEQYVSLYKNGKLKKKYSYNCDQRGVDVLLEKNETEICEQKEYNADGSYIIVTRRLGSDGKAGKSVSYFDKFGKKLKVEFIGSNNVVTYSELYLYNEQGKLVSQKAYSEEVLFVSNEYMYDNEGNLVQVKEFFTHNPIFSIKKKESKTYITKYDRTGKIIEKSELDIKNDLVWGEKFEYNDKGVLVKKVLEGDSENTQPYTTEYKYSFE